MASTPSHMRIFVSYARKDGVELALRLQHDLTAQQFDVWLDKQRIHGGASWTKEIEIEIDRAHVVIALLTSGAYVSDICRAEQLRSIRAGKRVIPLLAERGTDVPLHLEPQNYRDFSSPDNYNSELSLLQQDIRSGTNGVPLQQQFQRTRTNLVTAPPLPRNYLPRPDDLARLRDAVITDEPGPSVALTALRGMGGIGKTILARALCDDEVVQQAFPDGIAWTTVGKEAAYSVITRMQEVRRALGDEPATNESEPHCINRYRTVLSEKAALIIVDDVWRREDIEPFLADSPRSRILFTTRDGAIAAQVGANSHLADLLTPEQSRTMLARWAALKPDALPGESTAVIRQCGRLPLALSMIGALLRDKPPAYWHRVLTLLQTAQAESLLTGRPHTALLSSVHVSVEALSARDRERYLALAVLLEDMPAADVVQQTLWNADEGEALETAERFIDLSLAQRDGGGRGILLHDLQLDYIRTQHRDPESLTLIHGAIRLSSHVIEKDPRQFASQVVGRLLSYRDASVIEEFIDRLTDGARGSWIRPLQPALHPPGTPLLRTLEQHADSVRAVLVSRDGRHAISASSDGTLKVWDVDSGQLLHTLEGHVDAVNGVGVIEDIRRAVSASSDGTLKVWDVESGQLLRTLEGHADAVNGVWVSEDGRRAVSASSDRTLKVWDVESGQLLRTLEGHTDAVNGVWVSQDGRRAVSASWDRTLKVWDVDSGQLLRTLEGHADPVFGVWVSGDGHRAVSTSWDRSLKVWDTDTGQLLRTLEGHADAVWGVGVSGDARRVVSASWDRTLKVWDMNTGQLLRTLEGHADAVNGVGVSEDGRRAVSASWDGTLKVWDMDSGQSRRTIEGHAAVVNGLGVSADGRHAVSASSDRTLKVWDTDTGQLLRTLEGHEGRVYGVGISADGQRAVSASWDRTLKVWDTDTGQLLRTLAEHTAAVRGVTVSADGRRVVSASWDRTLKVWDTDTGQLLCTLEGHADAVNGVGVNQDGKRAVSASSDRTLKVWDTDTGQLLRTLEGHADAVNGVALSQDGRRAVSASSDRTLKVWETNTGQLLRTLDGHTNVVNGVGVSEDGRRVVSASSDRTVKVWDVDSGACVAIFICDGIAHCCAFTANGKLIAGDALGRVHFLEIEFG